MNNNNLSTKSDLSEKVYNVIENAVNTDSIATISETATKSDIATKSVATKSIIKGDKDIYGNIVEYDPEDWVGEDHIIDKDVNINNIYVKDSNEMGILDISLSEDLMNEKSNILVSLVDQAYNVHNIYIYYRNDFHEKVELSPGKYKINNIKYLASNEVNITATISEIEIVKDKTTNLVINYSESEIVYSTISEMTDKEIVKIDTVKQKIPFYIYIIIVLAIIIFVFAIVIIVKKVLGIYNEKK